MQTARLPCNRRRAVTKLATLLIKGKQANPIAPGGDNQSAISAEALLLDETAAHIGFLLQVHEAGFALVLVALLQIEPESPKILILSLRNVPLPMPRGSRPRPLLPGSYVMNCTLSLFLTEMIGNGGFTRHVHAAAATASRVHSLPAEWPWTVSPHEVTEYTVTGREPTHRWNPQLSKSRGPIMPRDPVTMKLIVSPWPGLRWPGRLALFRRFTVNLLTVSILFIR